jgi:hypothetical protein
MVPPVAFFLGPGRPSPVVPVIYVARLRDSIMPET